MCFTINFSCWYDDLNICLLYTSDAADDSLRVDLGGRRIIKKSFFSSRRRHTRFMSVSVGSEMCIRDSLDNIYVLNDKILETDIMILGELLNDIDSWKICLDELEFKIKSHPQFHTV